MNLDIIIRKAVSSDLDLVDCIFKRAIITMEKNHISQWDEKYPTRNILDEDIGKSQMFLGLIDNHVVSVAVINQEFDEEYHYANWNYPEESFAIIHRFCVNPDFQNRGIAVATMKELEKQIKDMKINTIRLDAYSQNPYALKLYEKLGYVKTGEARWRKGLFYLYEKKI